MEEQLAPPLNKTLLNTTRNCVFNIPITPYTNIKKFIRYLESLGYIATTRQTPPTENRFFLREGVAISDAALKLFGDFLG